MEFRDLKKQYQVLKPRIDEAMLAVAAKCNFIGGNQVKELEASLAEYVGVKHCVTCGNGTDALSLMMMAWGVGAGDAVFVPDFTFFATGEIVSFAGATPIFVDVNADTFNLDAESLEKGIKLVLAEGKLKPKVVIPVDLFGLPANYDAINVVAKKYNLLVLEDGAQGFGGMIGEKRACSFGDAATTSFFPAKPLGCYGDGGAVFTNDDEISELLESYKVHGKGSFKYDNLRVGINSRLDTIQAAILQVKFQAFKDYELGDVNKVAKLYTEMLQGVVKTPIIPQNFYSSWAQYTLILDSKDQRDSLGKFLKANDIPSMVYYPKPMHLQQAFAALEQQIPCPITEKLCNTVLSLPMHPYMEKKDVEIICGCVKLFMKNGEKYNVQK
ncbi:MAG: DegT/DnrJ/EryC1/StrS family aminotransferase [Clostridiales bacterium]